MRAAVIHDHRTVDRERGSIVRRQGKAVRTSRGNVDHPAPLDGVARRVPGTMWWRECESAVTGRQRRRPGPRRVVEITRCQTADGIGRQPETESDPTEWPSHA